jgi:hypothetical protein
MAVEYGAEFLTDAECELLHPLIEACRPRGKTPPQHLRRTITAIVWRHTNGAKWRSIPPELGPWWMAQFSRRFSKPASRGFDFPEPILIRIMVAHALFSSDTSLLTLINRSIIVATMRHFTPP